MKKFIRIMLCFCLCFISLAITACGGGAKIEAPKATDQVYSNGGLVVKKGDFVYFANGYSSIQAIADGEQKLQKSYSHSNLTVAKADKQGNFERTENGSLKKVDSLSKKLAGFEATDLRIFGNYVYFTTVNTEKDKKGDYQVEKLEIRRIKLDGTSSERVFRSKINYLDENETRVVNFNYFEKDGNVFLLINENGKLKRVKCSNSSIGSAEIVAENITSLVVPEEDDDCLDGIFFLTSNEGVSTVNRYDVANNKIVAKKQVAEDDSVDSLFASKFGNLYFYTNFDEVGASYLYYLTYEQFENLDLTYNNCQRNRILHDTSTKIYLLESALDGILAIDSNEVKILDHNNSASNITPKTGLPTDAKIVLVDNGYVYFYKDSEIKCWNYSTEEVYTIVNEENTICDYGFDLVGNYLYYFATCGENDYMFRVNVKIENNESSELMGVYFEEDDPTKEDSSSEN